MPRTTKTAGPMAGRSASAKAKAQQAAQSKLSFRSTKATGASQKDVKDEPPVKKPRVSDIHEEDVVAEVTSPETGVEAPVQEQVEIQAAPEINEEEEEEEEEEEFWGEARKVKDAQIKRYWQAKEAARLAPRVHQKDLSLWEKVLREFDVSSKYGPSIGISRTQRWERAHDLGMNPPIEVLAVLLKGEDQKAGRQGVGEKSIVDELMSSRLGGSKDSTVEA